MYERNKKDSSWLERYGSGWEKLVKLVERLVRLRS